MNHSDSYQRGNPTTMSATQSYVSPYPAPKTANEAIEMDGNLSTGTDFVEYQTAADFLYNAISQDNLPPALNGDGYPQYSVQYRELGSMDLQSPYDPRLVPHNPVTHGQQDSNYGLVTQSFPGVPNDIVASREHGLPINYEDISRQDVGHVGYPYHSQYPYAQQFGSPGYGLQFSPPQIVPGAYVAAPVVTQASLELVHFDPAKPKRPYNQTPVSSELFKTKHEFGLVQMMITESDLRVIRKHYDCIPRAVYRKHEPNTEQSVRVTERELENLRIHMQRKGIKVRALQRKRDFMEAIPAASARYEKVMATQVARVTGRNMDDVLAEIRAHTV